MKQLIDLALPNDCVIYDSVAEPNLVSERLLSLIEHYIEKTSREKLLEVYTRANTEKEYVPKGTSSYVPIIAVEDEVWDEIEHYYGECGGRFPEGKTNLVLAVTYGPIHAKNVLLGTY